jgi:indole-3-glycerol phosphate synthase
MTDILRMISENAEVRVAESKKRVSLGEMMDSAFSMECDTGLPFEKALTGDDISFICECKQASPSKGRIVTEYPFEKIAGEYESAGASCISVLTEPKWFLGDNEHLKKIAAAVSVPCLRKDFTVDDYMIYEAKVLGASAVLLICSITKNIDLERYLKICDDLGLSALVEAHDEQETSSALDAGARMIGVNNRNLNDFTVDLDNSRRLREIVPPDVLFIAESGINCPNDIDILRMSKVDGVLIGETLMRSHDKKKKLDELRGTT